MDDFGEDLTHSANEPRLILGMPMVMQGRKLYDPFGATCSTKAKSHVQCSLTSQVVSALFCQALPHGQRLSSRFGRHPYLSTSRILRGQTRFRKVSTAIKPENPSAFDESSFQKFDLGDQVWPMPDILPGRIFIEQIPALQLSAFRSKAAIGFSHEMSHSQSTQGISHRPAARPRGARRRPPAARAPSSDANFVPDAPPRTACVRRLCGARTRSSGCAR
jgi:hypothetical protein